MANVSLEDVKKLREMLGTGMVDTKNALTEAEGDVDKAIEILRLKGAKGNAKRADRSTSEGLRVKPTLSRRTRSSSLLPTRCWRLSRPLRPQTPNPASLRPSVSPLWVR
jgi:translation elongation factor EF-Ts